MIKVENLRKAFGDLKAVDGLSFEIKSGEVKSLDGFNGQLKLSQEIPHSEFIVLSQNKKAMSGGNVHVMPWRDGIEAIFRNS